MDTGWSALETPIIRITRSYIVIIGHNNGGKVKTVFLGGGEKVT